MNKTASTAFFANICNWGRCAFTSEGQPTALYKNDSERRQHVAREILEIDADHVGIAELWDQQGASEMNEILAERYPYHVFAPFAPGIPLIVQSVKNLLARSGLPTLSTLGRYLSSKTAFLTRIGVETCTEGKKSMMSEVLTHFFEKWVDSDRIAREVKRWLHLPFYFGGGIAFWSKRRILRHTYHPHTASAGHEIFAQKGTIEATFWDKDGGPTTALVSHLQAGNSPSSATARKHQRTDVLRLAQSRKERILLMGDFNDDLDLRGAEFHPLQDACRIIHPDTHIYPGATHDPDRPFPLVHDKAQPINKGDRIDGMFLKRLTAQAFEVIRDISLFSDHAGIALAYK